MSPVKNEMVVVAAAVVEVAVVEADSATEMEEIVEDVAEVSEGEEAEAAVVEVAVVEADSATEMETVVTAEDVAEDSEEEEAEVAVEAEETETMMMIKIIYSFIQ